MMIIQLIRASVRPLVTLAFSAAIIVGFVMKLISPEAFVGIALLVIKYWFDDKPDDKPAEGTK